MNIIAILTSGSLFFLICFILATIYMPKMNAVVIPLLFLFLFLFLIQIPNYLGYSIDSKFLWGKEASVLHVEDDVDDHWIYLLVLVQGETQPRLVKMANTPKNKEAAEQAKQKAQEGVSIIRFGESGEGESQAGQAGEGNPSTSAGMAQSQVTPGNDNAAIVQVNPDRSSMMTKD